MFRRRQKEIHIRPLLCSEFNLNYFIVNKSQTAEWNQSELAYIWWARECEIIQNWLHRLFYANTTKNGEINTIMRCIAANKLPVKSSSLVSSLSFLDDTGFGPGCLVCTHKCVIISLFFLFLFATILAAATQQTHTAKNDDTHIDSRCLYVRKYIFDEQTTIILFIFIRRSKSANENERCPYLYLYCVA